MRLAVFGGAGRVGRHVVRGALERGCEVTALVREPEPPVPGVRHLVGDVLDPRHVEAVLDGAHAVLSSLGTPSVEYPGTLLEDGMRTITGAMRRLGVRRIIAVAGSGILDHPEGGLLHDRPEFPAIYRAISRAHAGTWHALRDSRLDWTLVCTTTQVSGARPDAVRAVADRLPAGGTEIAVEDVARFMLGQIDDARYLARRVGLSW
jgi:putative NADH-flavin reductase